MPVPENAGQADRGAMTERLRTRMEEVTSRQLEVARLVAEGRTNPEIASALGITLDGAKYHVSELLGRLGLERRDEIAEWYRSERRGQRMRGFGGVFAGLFASAPKAFASAAAVTAVVALGAVFAIGLSGGRAEDGAPATPPATPTPTPTSFSSEVVAHPPVGATGDASNLPPNVELLPFLLRQRLRTSPVTVVSWERIDWADGCFEMPPYGPDGGCPLSVSRLPGYRVVVDAAGEEYIVRTDIQVGRYALEAAPPIQAITPVYEWAGFPFGGGVPCVRIRLAEDGTGLVGGCGEARTRLVLGPSGVASRAFFDHIRDSLPITLEDSPVGLSRFATSTERSLFEWGRYLAVEAYTGRGDPSVGLAIGWRDDNADGCSSARVMQYGVVYLSECGEDGDGVLFLNEEELSRLYAWVDNYQSFEEPGPDRYLALSGTSGAPTADDAVREEIRDWLTALAEAPPPTSGE